MRRGSCGGRRRRLTNYKRFNVLPQEWRTRLTIGDFEHFRTYLSESDAENVAASTRDPDVEEGVAAPGIGLTLIRRRVYDSAHRSATKDRGPETAMKIEPLERFAYVHFPAGTPPRGIVVHFMGLGSQWQAKEGEELHGLEREGAAAAAAAGAIFLVPYLDPWNWMNAVAVETTDRILDLAIGRAGLQPDAPIVSTGGSMGGLCALVWPRYTRHRVVAVAANCPVCDLPFHYTERPDLPRTLRAAFGAEPDFAAALRARSPLHIAPELPDIPYAVFHCAEDRAVGKAAHSDGFVAAMRALGRRIDYVEVPARGHCDLDDEARRRYAAFAVASL